MTIFSGNTESTLFRQIKIAYSVFKIQESGLISQLVKEMNPSAIVLYGGVARGEDDGRSDIDLLVITRNKKSIDLTKFESKLKHRITLVIYSMSEWQKKAAISKPFYERILIDGIVLHGELPVVE